MKKYHLLNNLFGWFIFLIATLTYLITIEPTASLWDCGEFIASAYKLEVGHPPGAPLFMMLGRLFSMFVAPDRVALMINAFSALCSSFTILFLFWSITHLARKLIASEIHEFSTAELTAILGSGAIGALAFTFSDTFWFSAVEGEVYAVSSLFTALVFWIVLKWEEEADERFANRWLILLAYITGLSIGVHLLNLLVVPAIVFIYYFRKYNSTLKGIVYTSIISIVLLACLVWVIIPLVPKIGSYFELLFVNSFGLPINSGLLFYVALLAAILIYFVAYTHQHKKVVANTIALCFAMCILGYGSYAMIVIRSVANPPMEQNAPDNIFSLMSYLNRDQYGSRPLVKGPSYRYTDGVTKLVYSNVRIGDRYNKENWSQETEYHYTTLFPRMYGTDDDHKAMYNSYVKKGKNIRKPDGTYVNVPTFYENLRFFFDYQLNFMYWRYFMWNFVGRQNDYQATKFDPTKGNWISGFSIIDSAHLGKGIQKNLPTNLAENKGTHKYYFLPLILGLIGLFYQLSKDKKNFAVVSLLFFFTGIAIVIYLNQTPNEPRERDYAYAGSFYAFAIWIGLSVIALWKGLAQIGHKNLAAVLSLVITLPIPALMAKENWKDHDRSGRYIATDFGYNYLNSCEKDAILYTYGDNDTFPLWYNQEVEGVRTDMRVANMMYLSADWYYRQMIRKVYDSPAIKSSATPDKISGSRRNVLLLNERTKEPINIKDAINFAMSDEESRKLTTQFGDNMKLNYIPSKTLFFPINKAEVLQKGIVAAKDSLAIVDRLTLKVPDMIYKNNLAVLDFLANNFLERPIYYGISADRGSYMGVENNLRLEGLAYRLVPENVNISGRVDVEKTFKLLTSDFRFRGLNNPNVYLDETARRQTSFYRSAFYTLADALAAKNDTIRLAQLMDKFDEVLPLKAEPYFYHSMPAIKHYYAANQKSKALQAAKSLLDEYALMLNYYCSLSPNYRFSFVSEFQDIYQGVSDLKAISLHIGAKDLSEQAEKLSSSTEMNMVLQTLIEFQNK